MFIPNNRGVLKRFVSNNGYGEPKFAAGVTVSCGVVHLNKKIVKTSIRVDSSASRGASEEFVSVSKILFRSNVIVKPEDQFEIAGFILKASTIENRYSVPGKLDHFEIDFVQWENP